jgi:hypothetical protein
MSFVGHFLKTLLLRLVSWRTVSTKKCLQSTFFVCMNGMEIFFSFLKPLSFTTIVVVTVVVIIISVVVVVKTFYRSSILNVLSIFETYHEKSQAMTKSELNVGDCYH